MAQVQGEEIYLSHSGQEVDDNIDEVQAARGDSDDLSARLAAIVGDFEADQQRQDAEIAYSINTGAKNLLKIIATSQTKNGVTLTVNSDGSVSLNGTATSSTNFALNDNMGLPSGQYILSGNVPNNVYLTARSTSATNYIVTYNSPSIEIDADIFYVYINISSGTTLTNVVIKPMLRRASITDSTFQPYAPTNRELYEMILAMPSGGTGTTITDLMGYTWEQGTSDDSGNFNPGTTTTRILCQTYFDIPSNANAIKANGVANTSPLMFLANFYQQDRSFISELGWTNDYLIIPQHARYVRFVLRNENGSTTITPSQLSSCNMIIALQSVQSLRSAPSSLMQAGRIDAELTDAGRLDTEQAAAEPGEEADA